MDSVPQVSPLLLEFFTGYSCLYLGSHFHAIRLSRGGGPPPSVDGPLILVMNHPSWWDPLIGLLLARRFFPDRTHYAPIDSESLDQYRFFKKLGLFGIDPGSRRSAETFLRIGRSVLECPGSALWVTAEGQFTDPRERRVRLRTGVGHLARGLERGMLLPVALEYPFWQEKFPEALVRFGEPIRIERGGQRGPAEWTALLESRLRNAQDALMKEAVLQDPSAFEVILRGRAGVGGIYDLGRALRARMQGKPFWAAHGTEPL